MERRLVERYSMHLPAEVRVAAGGTHTAATVRDISSSGVSFYAGGGAWADGQVLNLRIAFGQELAGTYSYQLRVRGKIVRTGSDERTGREYCAVAFTDAAAIRDWREKPAEERR